MRVAVVAGNWISSVSQASRRRRRGRPNPAATPTPSGDDAARRRRRRAAQRGATDRPGARLAALSAAAADEAEDEPAALRGGAPASAQGHEARRHAGLVAAQPRGDRAADVQRHTRKGWVRVGMITRTARRPAAASCASAGASASGCSSRSATGSSSSRRRAATDAARRLGFRVSRDERRRPAAAVRRRRADFEALEVAGESLGALRAELVLLREENARLKAAPHQAPDIAQLLGARALAAGARLDDDSVADETTRVLVEGLVIRESLLEICQEIERAMVSFEARLKALESTGSLNGRARA